MTVSDSSRYRNAAVISTPDAKGDYHPTLYSMIAADPRRASFRPYVFSQGDRLDLIADQILGDPTLWWVIADLNPEHPNADEIPAGTVIRVPLG